MAKCIVCNGCLDRKQRIVASYRATQVWWCDFCKKFYYYDLVRKEWKNSEEVTTEPASSDI